jgi:hypothetical protein
MEEPTTTGTQTKRSPIRWSKRSSNWKRHLQEFQQFQEQKNVRRSYSLEHEEPTPNIDPGKHIFFNSRSTLKEDDDDPLTENSDDSETVIIDEDEVSIDNYENYDFEHRRRSGQIV